jgi:hypothetical protein
LYVVSGFSRTVSGPPEGGHYVQMVETSFIAVQVFMLVFLLVHDGIPLGSLNDVAGVRRQNAFGQLALATLINSNSDSVVVTLSLTCQ